MRGGNHTGHRVRGRYRVGEQIGQAVAGLGRGEHLVLECGADDECYAQTRLTPQGVYDVEFRDGSAAEHYRAHMRSAAEAAAALAAWAGAEPGWSEAFDWTCIASEFAAYAPVSEEPPIVIAAPSARATGGAKANGRVPIYHLTSRAHWQAARGAGEYRISTGDSTLEEHGFIHACFADQVESIADAVFAGAGEPPVVLVIDEDALPGPVRVEYAPDRRTFFPHIFGPVPVGAVSNVIDLDRAGAGWQWPPYADQRRPVPARIPIAREAGRRTDLTGRYADGLFLAGFCRTTYLHLFDRDGVRRWSWIAPAEHVHGDDADTDVLMDRLRSLVDLLPGRSFEDIAVEPFAVLDGDGERRGLFDETLEFGFPHAELRPDGLGFHPPWNGLYDT